MSSEADDKMSGSPMSWGDRGRFHGRSPTCPGRWHHSRPVRRRGVFLRLVVTFGLLALVAVGGIAALSRLFSGLADGSILGPDGRVTVAAWLAGLGSFFMLAFVIAVLSRRAFHGVAAPLADVMAAADAVADGDLSARVTVPKHGPDRFSNLAASFNRMAEELERAEQRRRNLTADVAHELRNPLHIIQGNLEGILDEVYEAADGHVLATLEETRLLARLIEDLRTLSLAEAGELLLRRELVDANELLADVQTSFSGQAEAAGLELKLRPAEDNPSLVGDINRLEQVLSNLMANAIRHTPPGGAISLATDSTPDGVRILVSDTGEGIPIEDQPYIFDRFWRGDRSRSRTDGDGNGLGLAIARQLVEAHRGRIEVRSKPGEGTTFQIALPATEAF